MPWMGSIRLVRRETAYYIYVAHCVMMVVWKLLFHAGKSWVGDHTEIKGLILRWQEIVHCSRKLSGEKNQDHR